MVSRADLLIAVIGIVASVVGSSTAMWMTLSKKADKDDLARLESSFESTLNSRMAAGFARLDGRMDRLDGRMDRFENKLDALILRFLPDHLPDIGT